MITPSNPTGETAQCDRRDIHGPHEYQRDFGAYFNVYCRGNDGLPSPVVDEDTDRYAAMREKLRLQRDAANSRSLRMWERAKAAETKLEKIRKIADDWESEYVESYEEDGLRVYLFLNDAAEVIRSVLDE